MSRDRRHTVDEFLAARLVPLAGVGAVTLADMEIAIAKGGALKNPLSEWSVPRSRSRCKGGPQVVDFRSPRRVSPGIQDGWNRKGLVGENGTGKRALAVLKSFYGAFVTSRSSAGSGWRRRDR